MGRAKKERRRQFLALEEKVIKALGEIEFTIEEVFYLNHVFQIWNTVPWKIDGLTKDFEVNEAIWKALKVKMNNLAGKFREVAQAETKLLPATLNNQTGAMKPITIGPYEDRDCVHGIKWNMDCVLCANEVLGVGV